MSKTRSLNRLAAAAASSIYSHSYHYLCRCRFRSSVRLMALLACLGLAHSRGSGRAGTFITDKLVRWEPQRKASQRTLLRRPIRSSRQSLAVRPDPQSKSEGRTLHACRGELPRPTESTIWGIYDRIRLFREISILLAFETKNARR